MHHRQQQTIEQFRVGDPTDPNDLDQRITGACSYEALPHPSNSLWSEVVPRLARLA